MFIRFERRLFFYVLLIITGFILAFPVYWMVVTSVKVYKEMFSFPPTFFPRVFDFTYYLAALKEGRILIWIINTSIIGLGTVFLNLFCATPAAYVLAKYRFRGKYLIMFLVLSTQMVPAPLIIVPLFGLFRDYGLINTHFGVILADTIVTAPLSTWILKGFFEKLPRELRDAGLVDGCTRTQVFFKIALPITLPVLLVVGVLTFFDTWNEYLFAVTFLTENENWVVSIGLASFRGRWGVDWREMMSYSLIAAALPLTFYLIFRKRIVGGLVAGFFK